MLVERFNGLVNQQLLVQALRVGDAWLRYLPLLEFALNARPLVGSASPFSLTFGFHPRSPADVQVAAPLESDLELPKSFAQCMRAEFEQFVLQWQAHRPLDDSAPVARFVV